MLALQTYHPAKLRPYVKAFWKLTVPAGLPQPYEEDIFPDGHHEIIFYLEHSGTRRKTSGAGWQSGPDAFFAGQTLTSYRLQMTPGAILYGIRCWPHTLGLLFDFPADILTGRLSHPLDGALAQELSRSIDPEPATTFGRWERLLQRRIAGIDPPAGFSYVAASVDTILRHKGDVRMSTLMRLTGVSGNYLDRSFERYVGITPKTLANIIKLNYFLQYKSDHRDKRLTECVYEANFYDQSHLTRLFRSVTGMPPKDWFARENFISDRFAAL
jgi:AraC-like DNA-binding protein